jgi:phage shock protein E
MTITTRIARTAAAMLAMTALAIGGASACSNTSADASNPSATVATGSHLNPVDFSHAITKPGTVLVDVRTAGEFAAGHIANAINIDVESPTFSSDIANLDKNATYALYCHSGRRSGIALQTMQQAGFTHVYDMSGGIQEWQSSGGTLVSGS